MCSSPPKRLSGTSPPTPCNSSPRTTAKSPGLNSQTRNQKPKTRLRGRRLYRETGWVFMKSDHVPRTVSEILRVFDSVKDKYVHAIPGS